LRSRGFQLAWRAFMRRSGTVSAGEVVSDMPLV